MNGRPVDGFVVYYGPLRQATPGDRLQVQVQSPGRATTPSGISRSSCGRIRAAPTRLHGFAEYVGTALSAIALPVVCLALGFWVAAVRIGDRSAWLLLVLLIEPAGDFGGGSPVRLFGRENILQPLLAGFGVLCSQHAVPALMLFGIAFPERLPLDRRFPWLKWIVAGYLLLVAVLGGDRRGTLAASSGAGAPADRARRSFLTGVEGDFGAARRRSRARRLCGSLGWKTMTAPTRDARRRLMLLFAGAAPGVIALLILLVAQQIGVTAFRVGRLLPLIAMMLAFPLTMAYVIVVHRAMDVRVVIRQGLQYVLARGGIRAIQIALLVAVSIAATSLLSSGAGFARVAERHRRRGGDCGDRRPVRRSASPLAG